MVSWELEETVLVDDAIAFSEGDHIWSSVEGEPPSSVEVECEDVHVLRF